MDKIESKPTSELEKAELNVDGSQRPLLDNLRQLGSVAMMHWHAGNQERYMENIMFLDKVFNDIARDFERLAKRP